MAASPAAAQEDRGGGATGSSFGLGAQSFLRGPGGVSGTMDFGLIHVDLIVFLFDVDYSSVSRVMVSSKFQRSIASVNERPHFEGHAHLAVRGG